jgi:hypothetical protein
MTIFQERGYLRNAVDIRRILEVGVPGKLPSLRKRLTKLEQTLAKKAKQKELEDCICKDGAVFMLGKEDEFEAEMNVACPVHGFRRLGQIVQIVTVAPESYPENEKEEVRRKNARSNELMKEYETRLAAAERHAAGGPGTHRKEKRDSE